MKQQFEMTDKMIGYANKKMREFDTSFNFDMDNQSRELTSEYQAVYEALPFQNLKEFERWLELDDSAYNVETVINLMNTNKPVSYYLNDDTSKIFGEATTIFDEFFHVWTEEKDIEAGYKGLFTDLCFMFEFYRNLANTLDYGKFRNEIIKRKLKVGGVAVSIYDKAHNNSDYFHVSDLDDFTNNILETSAYYRKMLNR